MNNITLVKKIICCGSVGIICMMCLAFSACKSGIWFNVGYGNHEYFGIKGNETSLLTVVNSLQELQVLCDEWGNGAFNEESDKYQNEKNKKLRQYNDGFFAEKSLIICSIGNMDLGANETLNIKDIKIEKSQILITYTIKKKKGFHYDIAYFTWLSLIEVKKGDIVGASTIGLKKS